MQSIATYLKILVAAGVKRAFVRRVRDGAEQWGLGAGVLYCASGVAKRKCRELEVSHFAT